MEKIISEFKVVETEDGFRIEIKGDKEAIRRMLGGFSPKNFFRGGMPFGRGFHFDFGPGLGVIPGGKEKKTKRKTPNQLGTFCLSLFLLASFLDRMSDHKSILNPL
jgi:hypothetical protein